MVKMKKEWWLRIAGFLSLVFIVGLTIYAYSIRHQLFLLERYGYPGIFLVEFIANASVLLPIPGSAVTAAVAPLFNPLILAAVASTAASFGEIFGYLVGLGGSTFIEESKVKWVERIEKWMGKYGGVTIAAMAAIPNPLFDTAGIAAGALKYPGWKFFLWCWLGKTINRLVIIFGAGALIRWFIPL
jgi:membrane protein YqaA with SNARE-associated domain